MAEDITAMMTRYAPVKLLTVEAETPEFSQGDTEARPRPTPSASSARLNAAATIPPTAMLPQETAETVPGMISVERIELSTGFLQKMFS
jgi:hypothetical protein